ncbi:type VII secretion protein EccB [Pseudonocardia humida]|uniref:Type VII secretion protein EccB n=1 Tax=Pseudonocardia humida TaxID=2800819 RepID=A0ABT0ZW24_9PSEU|nr:type VII secretion protein EccB [Pseudonocardia humida]MCO1654937.1 type VII secretion protein EccB [Pseudonocardia humida]
MPRPTAVRAPATRDQADAYRFGLRRLEAALVRGDAVLLHEQIRSQRRAAVAGVALGLLGLCAAALYAVIAPQPDWRRQAVVSVTGAQTLYAVDTGGAGRLVPVEDLAAARLVLAALGRPDAATAGAQELPERALKGVDRTAAAPVAGADGARPDATIAPSWAVCDVITADGTAVGTTVIGGAAPVGPPDPGRAVLLGGADDDTWLVTGGRRFRVDVGDGGLLAAYGLAREVPRPVNPALLEMLPEGPELRTPVVPDRGDPAPDGLPGRVGDVLVTAGEDGAEYYVVLSDGVQRVPEVAADLLRVASGARAAREVDARVPADARPRRALDVADWPAARPRLDDPATAPVTCWTWTPAGERTGEVWTGTALPLPAGAEPVALVQADGPGDRVDAVWTGAGGAVRTDDDPVPDERSGGSTEDGAPERDDEPDSIARDPALNRIDPVDAGGQVLLVGPNGVVHRVADEATAAALGVGAVEPAPGAVLDLLPLGAPLDLADAMVAVQTLR